MKASDMKKILAIISQCDVLTIEKKDKDLIIAATGTIIIAMRKVGLISAQISALYAILTESTWDDGYFCACVRQIINAIWPVVDTYEMIAEALYA